MAIKDQVNKALHLVVSDHLVTACCEGYMSIPQLVAGGLIAVAGKIISKDPDRPVTHLLLGCSLTIWQPFGLIASILLRLFEWKWRSCLQIWSSYSPSCCDTSRKQIIGIQWKTCWLQLCSTAFTFKGSVLISSECCTFFSCLELLVSECLHKKNLQASLVRHLLWNSYTSGKYTLFPSNRGLYHILCGGHLSLSLSLYLN